MKNLSKSQGVTLLELIIVMAIFAILSGLATVGMSGLIDRGKIDKGHDELMNSFVLSRNEAISRNQQVVMCTRAGLDTCTRSDNWEQGWLSFADANGNGSLDVNEDVIGVFEVHEELRIRSASAGLWQITFQADGAVDDAVSFRVCGQLDDLDHAYTTFLSVTGRPRSSEGAASCP